MKRADELAAIAAFLATRGATRCPTVAVEPTTGLEQPAQVPVPPQPSRKDRHRTAMGWRNKGGRQSDIRPRIAKELAKDPGRTNAAIAAIIGCSVNAVWLTRQALAAPMTGPSPREPAEPPVIDAAPLDVMMPGSMEPTRPHKRTESKSRAAELLAQDPTRSDRQIAQELGCSRRTVALARSAAGIPALCKTSPTLDRAREAVAQDPGRSTRQIAKALGCSAMTVLRARQSLAGKCPVCGALMEARDE